MLCLACGHAQFVRPGAWVAAGHPYPWLATGVAGRSPYGCCRRGRRDAEKLRFRRLFRHDSRDR